MPREQKITLYRFDELNKDIQEELIEEARSIDIEGDLYPYHDKNTRTLHALADLLYVQLKNWKYDAYHQDFEIEIDYDAYKEICEEHNIKLTGHIDEMRGEKLQKLLGVMFGKQLNAKKAWHFTSYYLDRIGWLPIEKVYTGKLDVTLDQLLHIVFDRVIETCHEEFVKYYSDEEVAYRLLVESERSYCYLKDGTPVYEKMSIY